MERAAGLTYADKPQTKLNKLDAMLALTSTSPEDAAVVADMLSTSLEVFGWVVDQIQFLPVLLIVTYRPEFSAPWAGQSHVTSLTLNRLGEGEAAAIVARLVGNKMLPAAVMAEIVERTDGIPLFVEEMTKAVLEAEGDGATQHTVAVVPSPSLGVPSTLHASLMARLDRLGPAKEVAQVRVGDRPGVLPCAAGFGSAQTRGGSGIGA